MRQGNKFFLQGSIQVTLRDEKEIRLNGEAVKLLERLVSMSGAIHDDIVLLSKEVADLKAAVLSVKEAITALEAEGGISAEDAAMLHAAVGDVGGAVTDLQADAKVPASGTGSGAPALAIQSVAFIPVAVALNSPTGTKAGNVDVAMTDGSKFTGMLSFTPNDPNFQVDATDPMQIDILGGAASAAGEVSSTVTATQGSLAPMSATVRVTVA
jgi:hypothetical protein